MGAQEIEAVLAGVVRILPDMGLGVGVEIVNGNEGIALLPLLLQGGDGSLGIVDLQSHVAGGHLEGKGAAVLRNGHVFSLGIGRGYLVDGFVCGDGNGLAYRRAVFLVRPSNLYLTVLIGFASNEVCTRSRKSNFCKLIE